MIDRHSAPRYQVLRSFVFVAALATLAGCGFPVNDRGNLPKADLLGQIKPGVTDKNSVKALLGTPSSIAAFDGDTWYYISKEERQIAFLKPEVMNQQVYVIHFDDKGIVSEVSHKGLDDARNVKPNPDATPAPGREFTFLEQLIGNFGKFNAGGSGGATPGGPPTNTGP
jgi:outer membrane protein assembly factor BamE (lipoprotein component of BamABCDE complex)